MQCGDPGIPFSAANPTNSYTYIYKAARPQAERELSNKNIGRKAASLVGMQNFAWSTRAHHHGNTTSIAKNNLFLLS